MNAMKRAKQKHRPAGVSSEYVVFLPPESDIYKALRITSQGPGSAYDYW